MLQQTLTYSFLAELWAGVHVLPGDTLRMALYTDAANLGPLTTAYTAAGEASGAGYVAQGVVLTNVVRGGDNARTTWLQFDNPQFPPGNYAAAGALIFNASKANRAVAVLNFGSTKTADPLRTLNVMLPPATASTALLRLALPN